MQYRNATAQDTSAIAALHADSWRQNYRGAFSDAFLDGEVLADRMAVWTERLSTPGPLERTMVADDDGAVVGFAHAVFDDHPTWGALLDNLHVARSSKRGGVGSHLMGRTAGAVIERRPKTGLYLWVLEQNKTAQGFYEALGGTCVERGFGAPPGGGSPARLRYAWSDPSVLLVRD
jgi:ribosomal protein S18 acetylase RimI-like enzyme